MASFSDVVCSPPVKTFHGVPSSVGHASASSKMEVRFTADGRLHFVGSHKTPPPTPPTREKRVIRFLGSRRQRVQPKLDTHPLLSSSDLGFAVPSLSTPRQKETATTDRHTLERRRRLVEASFLEREKFMTREMPEDLAGTSPGLKQRPMARLEAKTVPGLVAYKENLAPRSQQVGTDLDSQRFSRSAPLQIDPFQARDAASASRDFCAKCGAQTSHKLATSVHPNAATGTARQENFKTAVLQDRKTVRSSHRMQDVKNSAAHAIPPIASKDSKESTMNELADLHHKLDGWYQGILDADEEFRSDALYLELKMQELLGPLWAERKTEPDMIRTTVCCDMLGRLIASSPSISKLGTALLDELTASIFQQKGRAIGQSQRGKAEQPGAPLQSEESPAPRRATELLELGEPYFTTARKLQTQVGELQEVVGRLRQEHVNQEEEKMHKVGNLVGRITGRLGQQSFRVWKRRWERNLLCSNHQRQLRRKRGARWLPRVFFRWVAAAEVIKRQRWQRMAEMLKWERDFGVNARHLRGSPTAASGPATPTTPASARSHPRDYDPDLDPASGAGRGEAGSLLGSGLLRRESSGEAAPFGERGRMLLGSLSAGGAGAGAGSPLSLRSAFGGDSREGTQAESGKGRAEGGSAESDYDDEDEEEADDGGDSVHALQPFRTKSNATSTRP